MTIKFHDINVQRLTGVRHIPDLSKKLISLGPLEEKGCKFQSESYKGALTIMKAKSIITLFFLQGSMVIGSATIARLGTISDTDATKLWHI